MEVNEEDDVCREESMDQIPWPVLQYHQQSGSLDSINNVEPVSLAPPLPDKKRQCNSGHGSPVSPKASFYDNASDVSSKESSPTTVSAVELVEPASENLKEAEMVTPKSSGGLVRKSSILKIRAFFEKSQSEPRASGEKSKTASTTRKASSFRLKEAPTRFYRSLEPQEDPFPKAPSPSLQPVNKLSLLTVPTVEDTKPSLPVKRSKSMKVYRSFQDVQQARPPVDVMPQQQQPPSPPSCEVIVSKSPSITYITTSKEAAKPASINNNNNNGPSIKEGPLPLSTSSLDRAREQRVASKSSTVLISSTPVGGSLDRSAVVHSKVIPTYVNVLMRNQEAAGVTRSSRLDSDTRQLLKDCQAYLMTDEDPVEGGQKIQRRATLHDKKAKDRGKQERRHSFKHAIGPDSDVPGDNVEPKGCDEVDEVEPKAGRKKAHEYEAIWLSAGGQTSSPPPPSPAEVEDKETSGKEATVFVQKSDEIRLLLTELRSPAREESSPRPAAAMAPVPLSPSRLHPDRVLSELQELVERANRSKEEAIQSEVALQLITSSPSGRKSPSPGPSFPVPSSMSSTPSPGLISPIPIKVTPQNPSSSSSGFYRHPGPMTTTTPPAVAEPKAPAFRPPPPYPAKLYVKLPPVAHEERHQQQQQPPPPTSPRMQRRLPPEYKAPPPVQRPSTLTTAAAKPQQPQQQLSAPQPIAPPRSKRQTATHLTPAVAFPKGPPIPTRSFVPPSAPPGIDLDAVAAVMAASAETTSRAGANNNGSSGSSSPTTAANKALSKALGMFHATAASFKTKLATQFGDSGRGGASGGGGDADSSSSSSSSSPLAGGNQPAKMERESSFVKPTVGKFSHQVTSVNTI